MHQGGYIVLFSNDPEDISSTEGDSCSGGVQFSVTGLDSSNKTMVCVPYAAAAYVLAHKCGAFSEKELVENHFALLHPFGIGFHRTRVDLFPETFKLRVGSYDLYPVA